MNKFKRTDKAVKEFIKENVIDKIHNKILGVKYTTIKFARWLPVIWNDEDYDHYYLYVILHRKLKNMQRNLI